MATAREEIDEVREWLLSEVRLDRYADKLELNGFTTLQICCTIDENALDKIGIQLPYHRKRFLMFVEKLKEKLGLNLLTNEEDGVTSNMELTSSETGNEQLIHFDSEDESSGPLHDQCMKEDSGNSLISLPTEDGNSENIAIPALPPKRKQSLKLPPPPIPRRADLEEEEPSVEQRSKTVDTHAQDSKQPEVPPKKIPVKPPRRTIAKPSSENAPEIIPNTDAQTGIQEQRAISNSHVNDTVAVNTSEEDKAFAQINSTPAIFPELPKPEENMNKVTSADQVNEERATSPNEPKRPAPKAPERVPAKRPTPAPRNRVKSEDGILESALSPKSDTTNDSKPREFSALLNNTLEKRTKSFSTPVRKGNSLGDKPSTLPRSATTKRAAPPPVPPSRQTTAG
ncbi:phosphatidylinositol-3,4,5-trisphosphate binding [Desmophyllum pertusum]|uniref:Phosphatidylinositol-3,4,5-trisphosphate binding n=1 Tax=Desmophyllum pertusum TaxID=174260 RepID=A0A9W9Z027_9CNID|nr:phosphatidylinositol-3,4,5-trisphosphate binding [Desmophyllum pertusum]